MNLNSDNKDQPELKDEQDINLESLKDFVEEPPRFTGRFNNSLPIEENNPSNLSNSNVKMKMLIILKSLILNGIPLIFLLVYTILILNYVTLFYFMIALLLVNLEFENYYTSSTEKNPLNAPLKEEIILYRKKKLNYFLHFLIAIVSLLLFIFKIVYCFLLMFHPVDFGVSDDFLKMFDIFLTRSFVTKDCLLMFLPNFIVMIISMVLIILGNDSENKLNSLKLDLLHEFKILNFVNNLILICFLALPAFHFSFTGLIFYFLLLVAIFLNTFKKFYGVLFEWLYFFYQFMKMIFLIVFFLSYFAAIQIKKNNITIERNGFLNFRFLGLNTFYEIISIDVF